MPPDMGESRQSSYLPISLWAIKFKLVGGDLLRARERVRGLIADACSGSLSLMSARGRRDAKVMAAVFISFSFRCAGSGGDRDALKGCRIGQRA